MSAFYQPTFVLKKVDPLKMVQLYQSGHFKNYTLATTKIVVDAAVVPSMTGETQTFRDKNNCVVVIHTTNNECIKSLPGFKPRCFWCMQDLSSDFSLHVPIPTYMTKTHNWEEESVIYHFETDGGGKGGGSCCSFECALSYIRYFYNGKGSSARNYSGESLEIYLKSLYKLCHPDKGPLIEAPDFRLLASYGGTMTGDEFSKSKSQFIPLPYVVCTPVSHQFMVQNQPKS